MKIAIVIKSTAATVRNSVVRAQHDDRSLYAKQLNKAKKAAPALPTIPKEVLDQFGQGAMSAEAINAASMAFKRALIERTLGAELSHQLGYPHGADKPVHSSNQRSGTSGKTVLTKMDRCRSMFPATAKAPSSRS